MKITKARITAQPKTLFDPMPQVFVETGNGCGETFLFSYYPDEISFRPKDFIGLTLDEARALKGLRDREYLRR